MKDIRLGAGKPQGTQLHRNLNHLTKYLPQIEDRIDLTEESKCCLRLWAEYFLRAVRGEFPVHESIKNSDFFDDTLELLGISRSQFEDALHRNRTDPAKRALISGRINLAKYGNAMGAGYQAAKYREKYRKNLEREREKVRVRVRRRKEREAAERDAAAREALANQVPCPQGQIPSQLPAKCA